MTVPFLSITIGYALFFSLGEFGLFCLSSLNGVLSSSFSSGSCFLAARTASFGLSGSAILKHGFVVVDELDEAGLCVVAETETGFKDSGISAGAGSDLLGYFLEENFHGLFVLEIAEDEATVGHRIFLGTVGEGLSLCKRGVDALVEDEGDGHISQHGCAVSGLAAKVIEFFIVSHRGLFFIEFVFGDVHAE